MKKDRDQMLPEYDFAGKTGVRGKYAKAMKDGYTIKTFKGKKVAGETHYVAIESDVHEYFPDSSSVNGVLRKIISLVPGRAGR
ncbi:MAG: hypothetical protein DMF62_14150 [Acidobacteria bacterium]|nr:MAG: hypothetical protein DMF62_14150 [Acidobacteriota bacterium]